MVCLAQSLPRKVGKAEALVARSGWSPISRAIRKGRRRRGGIVSATAFAAALRSLCFDATGKSAFGAIDLRGNEAIAFAKIEMRFHGKNQIGADPVLVVLQREVSHWRAFCVSSDLVSITATPALCAMQLRSTADKHSAPPAPRLLRPADGGNLGEGGQSFGWEIPLADEPLAAQVCEVLLDDKDSSWPLSRIKVYSGEPPGRSLLEADTV